MPKNVQIIHTQRHSLLPELKSSGFRVIGKIFSQCSLAGPINGELTVETSAISIHSMDIQLFHVESILLGEKIATETSLIQTTQETDGNVCHNLTIPIYVILPRLLTCPTTFAGPFSIEFKVAIIISFQLELSQLHKKTDFGTPKFWPPLPQFAAGLPLLTIFHDSNIVAVEERPLELIFAMEELVSPL
ncbi:uncharacterized protein [Arachis hypogaea]|uniref:uncharacterized protein n=1 Tax=Arachis hypogaea TaxID=3818 RepID=UPI000DEC96DD|nr:Down syndrome critical region protein 3 homolog [Arachis hypogaea]